MAFLIGGFVDMDKALHLKLIASIAQGDRKAFEQLYLLTSSQLYAVSLQLLQRKDLAEEALQEAFVRIWHNASEYGSERGSVLTWMISIVRYRAIDMLRAAKVRDDYAVGENNSDEGESTPLDVNLMDIRYRVKIDECMDHLEKPQVNAINLAYFKGYTHHEVCHHMGSPLGSVKSWIRRGLQRLKRCLES